MPMPPVSDPVDGVTLIDNAYIATLVAALNWLAANPGGGSVSLTTTVTQTSHGFSVGQAVRYTGTAYALAQADTEAHATGMVGVVAAVSDANTFTWQQAGYCSTLSGLTQGSTYYLSPTVAGALSATEPTASGQLVVPMLVALSSTSAIIGLPSLRVLRNNPLTVAEGGTGVQTLTGLVKAAGIAAFVAAVQGTDYYAPSGTDVAVTDGGTGASDAATARTNLGAAPLASPTFTGTPAAPTAAPGTNTTQLATCAFVEGELSGSSALSGTYETIASAQQALIDIYGTGGELVDGCTVAQQGAPNLSVQVASGHYYRDGIRKSLASVASLSIADNTSGNERVDLITIDNTDTVVVLQGTPGNPPSFPSLPSGSVLLATLKLPTGLSGTGVTTSMILTQPYITYADAGGSTGRQWGTAQVAPLAQWAPTANPGWVVPGSPASLGDDLNTLAYWIAHIIGLTFGTGTSYTLDGLAGALLVGDGSDGAVTMKADTTLTRDMYYSSLTVAPDIMLHAAGFRIHVAGELALAGPVVQTGSTTNTSAVVTGLASTSLLYSGMAVSGSGIPGATTISTVDSSSQVTLSAAATATGAPSLTFGTAAGQIDCVGGPGGAGGNATGTTGGGAGTAGTASAGGYLPAGAAGVPGVAGANSNGTPGAGAAGTGGLGGTNVTNSIGANGSAAVTGGAGGDAGTFTGGAGGAAGGAGVATALAANAGGVRSIQNLTAWRAWPAGSAPLAFVGGATSGSGGGGGAGGVATGATNSTAGAGGGSGGSGAAGGHLVVICKSISGGGNIVAVGQPGGNGGNGSAASAGADAIAVGGGGGGAGGNGGPGGIVVLVRGNDSAWTGAAQASGGAGGAGGNGQAGGNGGAGGVNGTHGAAGVNGLVLTFALG